MNFRIISTLFRTELRMVLRDRRMVITSLVLPLLITPLMFFASTWTIKKREKSLRQMVYHYAVTGPEAEQVRSILAATRKRLTVTNSSPSTNGFQFEEVKPKEPLQALTKGELQLVLEGSLAEAPARSAAQEPAKRAASAPSETEAAEKSEQGEPALPGCLVIRLVFRADRDVSQAGMSQMETLLRQTREAQRSTLLKEHGFTLRPKQMAVLTERDLASKGRVAGLTLGRMLTLLLLFFVLVAGAVIATDSLAGEKERGTLETLLTTGATRAEILTAKHLVVQAVALGITVIQAANLLVYVGLKLLPVPADLAAAVSPAVAGLLLLLFLPIAVLAANCLLLISGYARSYKEAQMFFMPAMLIGLLPGLVPLMPAVNLRSAMVLVPVANLALGVKEVLVGKFDWPFLALSWVLTAGVAVWTMRLGARVLSVERLITASQTDAVTFAGGARLFERHVAGWFAVLWAVLLLVNNYLEKADVRLQVVLNLLVILFGGSCLMLWRYRLDPRAALALRAPRPAVWVGVLVAVPGGLLTALGLFRLSNLFLPVPTKSLESFDQSVLPPGIPFWQLLFCLTVLPGIFEEMAFRGLLLHGLHRRLRPVPLALVVGLAFAIYHVALFRFVPTACLGVMLAGVTLLTGSIFPAMVWHAGNNALGILIYHLGLPETELELSSYLVGAGLLAIAFWIFWRNRTPYPGLRKAGM